MEDYPEGDSDCYFSADSIDVSGITPSSIANSGTVMDIFIWSYYILVSHIYHNMSDRYIRNSSYCSHDLFRVNISSYFCIFLFGAIIFFSIFSIARLGAQPIFYLDFMSDLFHE